MGRVWGREDKQGLVKDRVKDGINVVFKGGRGPAREAIKDYVVIRGTCVTISTGTGACRGWGWG